MFGQGFTCPALLEASPILTRTGLSPSMAQFPNCFRLPSVRHWPGPRSLAATSGVSVDFLSSGYLDVSVPRVRLLTPMYSAQDTAQGGGFPHSEIHGSKLVRSSPWLIAAYHVLHRLLPPRHPPDALKTLDRSHYQCPPLTPSFPRQEEGGRTLMERPACFVLRGSVRKAADKSATAAGDIRGDMLAHSRRTGRNPFIHDVKDHAPENRSMNSALQDRAGAGGARRDRTDDLLLAKQALSQLSYGPGKIGSDAGIDPLSTPDPQGSGGPG